MYAKKNVTINTCALPETEVKFNFRQRQKTTEMTVKVKYSQIFKSLTSDLFFLFFCSVTTIKFMSERGQGFVGFISHLMIIINSQSIVNRDRASVTWRVCTAMHHKPQFTCSFVASGAADPFLGVLMGVT